MQNNWNKSALTYAGFWVRLAAYLIDSVIVFFALLLVRLFSSGLMSLIEGTAIGGNVLFNYTLKDIILYVCQVLYFILFTYCTGTTPGKRLMNLRVVNADDGELPLTDVIYRETIGRFLCGLTIGIGYIMAGVDKEKRGLHDMLCDTRVIYAKRIKVYPNFQGPDMGVPFVPRQVTPPPGVPPEMPPAERPMPEKPAVGEQVPEQEPLQPAERQETENQPPRSFEGPYRMVRPGDETEERDS